MYGRLTRELWPALGLRSLPVRARTSRRFSKETRPSMIQPKPPDLFAVHTSPGRFRIYQFLTLLVALPLVIAGGLSLVIYAEEKKRPPFVPYTYLRLRHKKFPWGDGNHSLFHNPKYNALPDGYETPDDEEE